MRFFIFKGLLLKAMSCRLDMAFPSECYRVPGSQVHRVKATVGGRGMMADKGGVGVVKTKSCHRHFC